ncbi:hypothetical protein CWS43_02980 [Rahnella sp. AA]|nr:hypothetical protein CWS43_02980 [Rahnella sp. AA]
MRHQPDGNGNNINLSVGNKTLHFFLRQQRITGAVPELFPLVTEISRIYFFIFICGGAEIIDRVKAAAA